MAAHRRLNHHCPSQSRAEALPLLLPPLGLVERPAAAPSPSANSVTFLFYFRSTTETDANPYLPVREGEEMGLALSCVHSVGKVSPVSRPSDNAPKVEDSKKQRQQEKAKKAAGARKKKKSGEDSAALVVPYFPHHSRPGLL